MSVREAMLSRIRSAIGKRPLDMRADYAKIPRDYIRTATLDAAARLELFVDRLLDYDAAVHCTAESEIAQTVAAALAAHGHKNLVIPAGLPAEWLPPGFDFVEDRDLDYGVLDWMDGVVTPCTLGIALTGTIVLQNAPGQGRRAISLIPDYLLCVVRASQVVETVSEAMEMLEVSKVKATTFISGPSATADIEMTRVKGVHGPRTLEVVLVGDG